MYCHCCKTRVLRDEVIANGGNCPECGTVPEWHSKLWDDEDELIEQELEEESLFEESDEQQGITPHLQPN